MPSVGVWRHSGLLPLHRQRCLQRLGLSFLGRSFEFQLLRGKILKTQSYSLASFDVMLLHRSVVVPQDDLGIPTRLLHPARGRLTRRSWGRRLLMTRGQLLRREEQLRVGRLLRRWRIQGWRVLLTLFKQGKELLLGTSGWRPPQELLMSTPSMQDLLGPMN
jgi:hypothetical protein